MTEQQQDISVFGQTSCKNPARGAQGPAIFNLSPRQRAYRMYHSLRFLMWHHTALTTDSENT
jgi:hypothetical protein